MKDHILLVKSHKYELNKKGMLRIRDATYSDSGVYSDYLAFTATRDGQRDHNDCVAASVQK